jgi:serine/arginine repetitive matrix protein 1
MSEGKLQQAQKVLSGIAKEQGIKDFFSGDEHWGNYVTKHPEENRGEAIQRPAPIAAYVPPQLRGNSSPGYSPLGRSQAPSPPKSNSYKRRHRLGQYRSRSPSRSPPRFSRRRSPSASRSPPRFSRRRSPSRSPPRYYSRRLGRSPSRSPPRGRRYGSRSPPRRRF